MPVVEWAAAGALLLVLLLVPGYIVLRSLGVLRLQALAGAPAVLAFLLGGLAVVLHVVHVPWELATVLVGLVVLTALGAAIGRLASSGGRRRLVAEGGGVPPAPWWPLLVALAVAVAVSAAAVLWGMGGLGTAMQASDGTFHLNAVTYMRRRGDAFPVGAFPEMYWGSVHFYPAGWHSLVAILPTSVPAAANLTVLAGLAVLWPLGCASVLGAALPMPGRRVRDGLPLLVGTLASVWATAPFVMMTSLWPYGWSVCLLPGVLGLVMVMRPQASEIVRRSSVSRLGGVLAALLGALGVIYVHGTAAFNLALLVTPLLAVAAWRWLRGRWRAGWRHRSRVILVVVVLVVVVIVGFLAFRDQLHMLAGYGRKGGSLRVLIQGILRDDDMINLIPYGGAGATALSVVALLGVVPAVVRHRNRWAVLAVPLAFLALLGATWTSTPLGILASPWYKQLARILPVMEIPLLVLVATAVDAGCAALSRASAPARTGTGGLARRVLAAAVVALLAAVPVGIAWQRSVEHGRIVAYAYQPERLAWPAMLAPGEQRFIESSAKRLPEGAMVLGEPTNGSAFYWSLAGVDVVYPSLRLNAEPARRYVSLHAASLGTDPRVCEDLAAIGAHYYYTDDDPTEGGAPGGPARPQWPNQLNAVRRSQLTLVATDGTHSLWLISGCGFTR